MATARAHVRINASADDVWKQISDPDAIGTWFPGIASCKTTDGVRRVELGPDTAIEEKIVTNDDALRRFQYSIVPGGAVPVESHLSTVDVIDLGTDTLVVYAADVSPDALGETMAGFVDGITASLKAHIEG